MRLLAVQHSGRDWLGENQKDKTNDDDRIAGVIAARLSGRDGRTRRPETERGVGKDTLTPIGETQAGTNRDDTSTI